MIGVVGGGPAGLVAAIAARQAGFEVTVFERAPSFERRVDALVLINLLVEYGGERPWRQAGQRYEQIRKPLVTRIQDAAWLGGRIAAWRAAPARALRDGLLWLGAHFSPMRRAGMRLTAGFNPAEQKYLRKVTLKDPSP